MNNIRAVALVLDQIWEVGREQSRYFSLLLDLLLLWLLT